MSKVRVKVRIQGLVQGVFYRDSTRREALSLGVSGWIRNCADGSVEGVFEGHEKAVRELVDWCRSGPSAARVESVDVDRQDYRGEFSDFQVVG